MSGLEELRRLEGAATKGPWVAEEYVDIDGDGAYDLAHVTAPDPEEPDTSELGVALGILRPDAEFIVAARNQLPRILDALDAVLALADDFDEAFEKNPREPFEYGMHLAGSDIRAAITKALEGKQ